MDAKPTETLANFAAGAALYSLPGSARERARDLILDSVACALVSDYGDETQDFSAFARAVGGTGASTVIGSGETLSLLGATLLNAYQITAATVCDVYVSAHVHVTPEVIPPALAVAERDKLSGGDLLTAVAIGSEVAVRVADGIDYSVAGPRGWHMPGIVGPFGAAAAVGRLVDLSPLQMRNALGLAGSQAAGTWASWGTPSVKFHQSRGAASGLMAGLLAARDFTASAEILAHPDGGILSTYSNGGKPDAIVDGLGERYAFEKISLRLWPGGTPLQPALTAVFDLLAQERLAFENIARLRIAIAPGVHEAHARFDQPKGTFEALLSFHFAVGSALRDNRFWFTSLASDKADDPALRAFMAERVELVAEPALTREASHVTITLNDRRTIESRADAAKGTTGNPASLDDLRMKFQTCASGRLGQADSDELLELLVRIDEVEDLSRLFALLRTAGRRAVA